MNTIRQHDHPSVPLDRGAARRGAAPRTGRRRRASLAIATGLLWIATRASEIQADPEPFAHEANELSTFVDGSAAAWKNALDATYHDCQRGDCAMEVAKCDAIVAQLADAGAKPDQRLRLAAYAPEAALSAALGGIVFKEDNHFFVLVKNAPRVCSQYGRLLRAVPAAIAMNGYGRQIWTLAQMTPEQVGDDYAAGHVGDAAKCLPELEQAIKDGAPDDVALMIHSDHPAMTLKEARTKICDAYVAKAKAFADASGATKKAARDAAAAPYIALGVKGERLELFISYADLGFYAKGCKTELTEPKEIARAKALFHWLDGGDGTITIRKYTIKGNGYTISEKTYDRQSLAYKGCR